MRRFMLLVGTGLGLATTAAAAQSSPAEQRITAIADASACRRIDWPQRGVAPIGYVEGVALVFARALCTPDRPEVHAVSRAAPPAGGPADRTDALAWYGSTYQSLGLSNAASGPDTLRNAYALMIGLGMRESSGQYCVGRDRSANFTRAESAEAGVFQTSFGISRADPSLPPLTQSYTAGSPACLLDVFRRQKATREVRCRAGDAETFGIGPGADWQRLTKACPAFAVEYAAVVLRTSGGSHGEYGPIRNRAAEVRPVCNAMLADIQALIRNEPQLCAGLR
jgi:hypothetical protein